jgi:transcription antitermination factor NusG
MPMNEEPKWYILHTYSGYEAMVKDSLEKLIENNNLGDYIVDLKIPMEEVVEEKPVINYTYIAKNVKLLFRYSVDPNITLRIQEILAATLKHFDKADLHIRVRATVPDNASVILEFLEFPQEEIELLYEIIKVLGASGIGIAKAILEDPKK